MRQRLADTATQQDIVAARGTDEINLDDDGLAIKRITDGAGRALHWSVGKAEPAKGAPLTIRMGAARRIVIRYGSAPGVRALQWLPPSLTAGKRQPFLFSQSEPTNNRSWIPMQDSPGIRPSRRPSLGSRDACRASLASISTANTVARNARIYTQSNTPHKLR